MLNNEHFAYYIKKNVLSLHKLSLTTSVSTMNKGLRFFAIILSSSVVFSCNKPEGPQGQDPTPKQQITIPTSVDVKPVISPDGGEVKITFTAASAWTASVINTKADSWIDVSPKNGNPGAAEISIKATANDTYVERNATIQIKCGGETQDIVLTQKQVDNITVTTDKVELHAEGGDFTIELKTNIDFQLTISDDWIQHVSTKAYTGKTLTFTASPNEGIEKREGSIIIQGGEFSETVKVYQSGSKPSLVISKNEYLVEAEGGDIIVEVASNVSVQMIIPDGVDWISENSTKSVSTSTFHLDIAANEAPNPRSAVITFQNVESGVSARVTVNQKWSGFPSPETVRSLVLDLVNMIYQSYFLYHSGKQLEYDMSYAGLLVTYSRMLCDMVNNHSTIGYDWWTGYTGSSGYTMNAENDRQAVPYYTLYRIIKSANDIIDTLLFYGEENLDNDMKSYLGTAYIYRALMYHDIYNLYLPALNKYTDCSTVDGLTAPIILSSSENETQYKSSRAPKEAMAAQVFADLNKAEELFTSIAYDPKSGRYPSLAVVYGLKARMYMATLDYSDAAVYARKAINTSGKAPLLEAEWHNANKAFCDAAANSSWMWYYSISSSNMGNLCNPTGILAGEASWSYNSLTHLSLHKWLYDRINRTDFRKRSFIDPDRETYPERYYSWARTDYLNDNPFRSLPDYMSFKIRCRDGEWMMYTIGGAVDWPIMRVEEMYLIEAEAVGLSQGESAGIALLEDFMKTYRDPEYSYDIAKERFSEGFVKSFSEEVLFQKRIEFYGEGVGFFDAKRIRPGIITWYKGSNVIHNVEQYVIEEVSPFWNFVIPQAEIDSNDYLIAESEIPVEINGVKQTPNNPDPTGKVSNSTEVFD